MKIVWLHTDLRLYWPSRLEALRKSLGRAGHELVVVEIFGKGGNYYFDKEGHKVYGGKWICVYPYLSPGDIKSLKAKKSTVGLLDKINPDIVFAGSLAFVSGASAIEWGNRTRRKVVLFDDSRHEVVSRGRIVEWVKRRLYSCVDAHIYPSVEWEPTGLYWGFDPARLYYGVNVVDNKFWSVSHDAKDRSMGYFLYVGRFIASKNVKVLIKAYIRYASSVKREELIPLMLVGEGSEISSIRETIENSGFADFIKMLPFQDQHALRDLYLGARALFLVSDSEQWGLVVNEALANGCPCVVTSGCGASVMVKNGVNGYVVCGSGVVEVTECMSKLAAMSSTELNAMSRSAFASSKKWSYDLLCDSVMKALQVLSLSPKVRGGMVSTIISVIWPGRYRPV